MSDKVKTEADRNALAAEQKQERTQLEDKLAASSADITLLQAKIRDLQTEMDQVCDATCAVRTEDTEHDLSCSREVLTLHSVRGSVLYRPTRLKRRS